MNFREIWTFRWFVENINESELQAPKPLIKFGRWESQLSSLDYQYDRVITKLCNFAAEAGVDQYGRYFDAEPLLDFVLSYELYSKSAEYMYRHYVYYLLSQHELIDVDKEEMDYNCDQFKLL